MKVFVSFASEDREVVADVVYRLNNDGHTTFFDRTGLTPGEAFDARIRSELSRADLLVFFVSPEAVTPGRYTLTELKIFEKLHPAPANRVLPVQVRETAIASLPAYIRGVQILRAAGNLVAEVASAVAEISRSRSQRRWRRRAAIATATVVSVMVARLLAVHVGPPQDVAVSPDAQVSGAGAARPVAGARDQVGSADRLPLPAGPPDAQVVDAALASPVAGAIRIPGAHERPFLGFESAGPVDAFQPSAGIRAPAYAYWIGATEVTWREMMQALPALQREFALDAASTTGPWMRAGSQWLRSRTTSDRDSLPVSGVAWELARAYCQHVRGDLPSEEEWEWAARGSTPGRPSAVSPHVVSYANKGPPWRRERPIVAVATTAGDQVTVDAGAAFDFLGNVEEWTRDRWRDSSTGREGALEGYRVTRGYPLTSDHASKPDVRLGPAYRFRLHVSDDGAYERRKRHDEIGFRCVWLDQDRRTP